MKPDEMLHELADLFKSRNAEYGSSYENYGGIIKALFSPGVILNSKSDFNRFAILVMICSKLHRYALNFHEGGHDDSLKDISVYATMLLDLDSKKRRKK